VIPSIFKLFTCQQTGHSSSVSTCSVCKTVCSAIYSYIDEECSGTLVNVTMLRYVTLRFDIYIWFYDRINESVASSFN